MRRRRRPSSLPSDAALDLPWGLALGQGGGGNMCDWSEANSPGLQVSVACSLICFQKQPRSRAPRAQRAFCRRTGPVIRHTLATRLSSFVAFVESFGMRVPAGFQPSCCKYVCLLRTVHCQYHILIADQLNFFDNGRGTANKNLTIRCFQFATVSCCLAVLQG